MYQFKKVYHFIEIDIQSNNEVVQRLVGAVGRITQSKRKYHYWKKVSIVIHTQNISKKKFNSLEHIKVPTFSPFDIEYDGESSYKCQRTSKYSS